MADSNIEEILNKILSAVFGKDVRQAIHDGIKKCYEDATTTIIDKTLSKNGEAADAKSVGDSIIETDSELEVVSNVFDVNDITIGLNRQNIIGKSVDDTFSATDRYMTNKRVPVKKGDTINTSISWLTHLIYNSSGILVESYNDAETSHTVTASDADFVMFQSVNSPNYTTKLMVCINQEVPEMYIPFGKTSKRLEKIEKDIDGLVGTVFTNIILQFDQAPTAVDDLRIKTVVDEYGFPITMTGNDYEVCRYLLEHGCDIGTYSNTEPSTGWSSINDESENVLKAWDEYVKNAKKLQENVGVFNQVAWMARQNNTGIALETALKNNGYKVVRAYKTDPTFSVFDKEFSSIGTFGFYFGKTQNAIELIDQCISEKKNVVIFTHKLVNEKDEDTTGGYSCLVSEYKQMLDYLKEKVDSGLCNVTTFREYYKKCNESEGYERDYNRLVKMAFYNTTS